jgi:hypothetical protein
MSYRRFQGVNVTPQPNCHLCGLPIRNGMEVTVSSKPFHPSCIGKLMKEKKDGRTDDARGREKSNAR